MAERVAGLFDFGSNQVVRTRFKTMECNKLFSSLTFNRTEVYSIKRKTITLASQLPSNT